MTKYFLTDIISHKLSRTTMTNFQKFIQLHEKETPLLLGNVWDANSALLFEKARYEAIGTSSAAIANSLGYEDGEEMSFDELLTVVKSITSKVSIPLSVDMEAGYSRDVNEIIKNIEALAKSGVVGINIEDSLSVNKKSTIQDATLFSQIIKKIKLHLLMNNIDLFLNIRTDFYILGLDQPKDETIKRIKLYESAGADGIFVPCITNTKEIQEIVETSTVPINIMAMPELESFDKLQNAGVKRISMGPFVYTNLKDNLEAGIKTIKEEQSFKSLFQ